MIVYRIQDKQGRGPFKPGFSQRWVVSRSDHDFLIPFYEEFGYSVVNEVLDDEFCGIGCKTLDQLRRWFIPEEYRILNKLGFQAVRMHVDRYIRESNIQVFFARHKPLKKDVKPIKLYKDIS